MGLSQGGGGGGGGGGTSPGGSDGDVQVNNAGAFGGIAPDAHGQAIVTDGVAWGPGSVCRYQVKTISLEQLQDLGAVSAATVQFDAPLPSGAVWVAAHVWITEGLDAAGLTVATAQISADGIFFIAHDDCMSAVSILADGRRSRPGTNPHPDRGGETFQVRLTLTGAQFAALTAGSLEIWVYYLPGPALEPPA